MNNKTSNCRICIFYCDRFCAVNPSYINSWLRNQNGENIKLDLCNDFEILPENKIYHYGNFKKFKNKGLIDGLHSGFLAILEFILVFFISCYLYTNSQITLPIFSFNTVNKHEVLIPTLVLCSKIPIDGLFNSNSLFLAILLGLRAVSKYRTKIVMRRENHQILDLNQ
jgi:hypothetical protein